MIDRMNDLDLRLRFWCLLMRLMGVELELMGRRRLVLTSLSLVLEYGLMGRVLLVDLVLVLVGGLGLDLMGCRLFDFDVENWFRLVLCLFGLMMLLC